jgi:heme/copper-type cytochrome/quinol oxidase subunit 4
MCKTLTISNDINMLKVNREFSSLLNNRRVGFALLIPSTIIGIIVLVMNSYFPNEILFPILIINGIAWVSGFVLLNYKAKHSKRDKSKFKRTNTKTWDT